MGVVVVVAATMPNPNPHPFPNERLFLLLLLWVLLLLQLLCPRSGEPVGIFCDPRRAGRVDREHRHHGAR